MYPIPVTLSREWRWTVTPSVTTISKDKAVYYFLYLLCLLPFDAACCQLQTLPDLLQEFRCLRSGASQILRESELSTYTYGKPYIHSTKESSLNSNSNTLEPDLSQHDRPTACVVAQQYSFVAVTLRFHSLKEKLCALKTYNYLVCFALLKVHQSEIA